MLYLVLDICLVFALILQGLQFLLDPVLNLQLDHPPVGLGALVNGAGLLLQGLVDLDDGAADGAQDVAGALDALDGADGVAGRDLLARLGQLDKDDVAQRRRGVVGDADRRRLGVRRERHPLVRLRVLFRPQQAAAAEGAVVRLEGCCDTDAARCGPAQNVRARTSGTSERHLLEMCSVDQKSKIFNVGVSEPGLCVEA
jgi:hypothetical protein